MVQSSVMGFEFQFVRMSRTYITICIGFVCVAVFSSFILLIWFNVPSSFMCGDNFYYAPKHNTHQQSKYDDLQLGSYKHQRVHLFPLCSASQQTIFAIYADKFITNEKISCIDKASALYIKRVIISCYNFFAVYREMNELV